MRINELLERARRTGSIKLDLSHLGLISIPDVIAELPKIQSLNLAGNQLASVPDAIARIRNLQALNLSDNLLTTIPVALARHPNLQVLNVSDNQLTSMDALVQIPKLQTLNFSGNKATRIPDAIRWRLSLQLLNVSGNQLTTVPDAVAHLANLRSLDLGGNKLTGIPDSFAQLTSLKSLDLGGNHLTAFPEVIVQLRSLQSLFLGGNQLTAFPDSVDQLTALQLLTLGANRLTAIPPSIFQLRNLQSLFLGRNRLARIPDTITQLTNLKSLDLCGNQLAAIPAEIAQLTCLQSLNLSGNHLTTIPDQIALLPNLRSLDLSYNQLRAVPGELALLAELRILNLSGNQLTTVPEDLALLASLQTLNVSANQLTNIPEAVGKLTGLRSLNLANNQLKSIADAVAQLPNLRVIDFSGNPLPSEWQAAIRRGEPLEYLRSLAAVSEVVSPRTVKVILLGEPQSGKTTLREALQGNPEPCDAHRKETVGVDIVPIPVSHPIDGKEMYLNVWDFSGQQIEHATHQFFLTDGALYLILWNSRQGADAGKRDVYYWLELLRMRVPNARFLLVATHAELTPPDLPWPDIRRLSGDAFEGNLDVDFLDLRGFDSLRSAILGLAASSSSMNSRWNRKWLAVRDQLRTMKKHRHYLRLAEFRALIAAQGVDDADQDVLAGHLHELGEILYYGDRPDMSDVVLLDCEWVSELVGLVSRSSQVRKNRGILTRSDLDVIWPDTLVPSELRSHLLKLMDTFDLSYETKQHDELAMVVEALPPYSGEPLTDWDAAVGQPELSLVFEFPNLYRRLPPGIPTWGIARGHRFAFQKPWRNLALFRHKERNGKASLGMISADELKRKVYVRVRSHHPTYLHAILRDILDDTIQRYPGLEVRESVPCRCGPDCPSSFPLTLLEAKQSRGEWSVDCHTSAQHQSVSELLTGIIPAFPFPALLETDATVLAEIRRSFTAQWRGQQNYHESTCPNIFQLHPRREFHTFESLSDYLRKGEPWRLTLYCESDDEWHVTEHGVYDFDLDADWIDVVRTRWNDFAGHMRSVAPYLKAGGKITGKVALGAMGLAAEKLPDITADHRSLRRELGEAYRQTRIDIELRRTLYEMIAALDAERTPARKVGGLHKWLNEDGRVLWLCPRHYRPLQSRM